MMKMKWIERTLDWLYPPHCPFCGIPTYGAPCISCCKRLEGEQNTLYFQTDFCDRYSAPLFYSKDVRSAILQFKYHNKRDYSRGFATLMRDIVPNENYSIICSIPEYRGENRHYQTSAILSKELSKLLGIPYRPEVIKKIRKTKKQHEISYHERFFNLQNSFAVSDKNALRGNILLCDDIITTGSTVNEIAKVCKEAGAGRVCAVSVALSCYHIKR